MAGVPAVAGSVVSADGPRRAGHDPRVPELSPSGVGPLRQGRRVGRDLQRDRRVPRVRGQRGCVAEGEAAGAGTEGRSALPALRRGGSHWQGLSMVSGGAAVSAEVWIYMGAQAALGPGWWAWRRAVPRFRARRLGVPTQAPPPPSKEGCPCVPSPFGETPLLLTAIPHHAWARRSASLRSPSSVPVRRRDDGMDPLKKPHPTMGRDGWDASIRIDFAPDTLAVCLLGPQADRLGPAGPPGRGPWRFYARPSGVGG